MTQFSIAEAKDNLSRLVREVETGGEVRLTRRGRPVAVLVSHARFEALQRDGEGFRERFRRFRSENDLGALGLGPDEHLDTHRPASPGRDFSW